MTAYRSFALAATALLLPWALRAQLPDSARVVAGADRAIAAMATSTGMAAPGCAVGVSREGRPVYTHAFGMADLEYAIPITPETIFESGSVAKQFTAAAVVLLALDGKLGLDDPVRTYIPELPDYGAPLTIRHLLNHTGGVRDWGSVLSLTGFGRGDRVVSQDLAMDVIVHQRHLDFTPGAEYSYSNSGYTLLSTIVERVSKQSLPAFTAARFFGPLGMTHSSWREDYRRLVPGRAQAYDEPDSGAAILDMPFMNVYGNGGMLTTVGDWLTWNAMLDARSLGSALVDSLETTGVLNDGRRIGYALGLGVGRYRGQREIGHGGSTAGYTTYLGRYPDLRLSVAVMCNSSSSDPRGLARSILDSIAGPFPAAAAPDTVVVQAEALAPYASLWRGELTHMPVRTVVENGGLRMVDGPLLRPLRDGSFAAGATVVRFERIAGGKPVAYTLTSGDFVGRYLAERPWSPTAAELKVFAGSWHSDEADATFRFVVEDGKAFFVQRPATRIVLLPASRDHFEFGDQSGRVIWFTRVRQGLTLHVGMSRLRDMPFARVAR